MKSDNLVRLFFEYRGAILFKGLSALVGLVLSFVLARQVGASAAGSFFLFMSIVTVASVFCRLGGDNYLLRTIPHIMATEGRPKLIETAKYAIYTSLFLSVLLSVLAVNISSQLAVSLVGTVGIKTVIRFAAYTLPFYTLMITCSFFLLAAGKTNLSIAISGIGLPVVFMLGLAALVLSGIIGSESLETNDIGTLLSVYCFGAILVAAMSVLLVISNVISSTNGRSGSAALGLVSVRDGLHASMPFFIVSLIGVLNLNIGNLAVGYFLEPKDVAYFAVSTKIATSIALILTAVNSVSAPKFSSLYRSGEFESLQQKFRDSRTTTLSVGIVPFLLILFFPSEILRIFGSEFEGAAAILVIIAVGQFFNSATGPVTYLLQMTGNEHLFMKLSILTSLAAGAATVVLTSVFGLMGAAVASTMSLIVLNGAALIVVRKRLGISWI